MFSGLLGSFSDYFKPMGIPSDMQGPMPYGINQNADRSQISPFDVDYGALNQRVVDFGTMINNPMLGGMGGQPFQGMGQVPQVIENKPALTNPMLGGMGGQMGFIPSSQPVNYSMPRFRG